MNDQSGLPAPDISQPAPGDEQTLVDAGAVPDTSDFASKAKHLLEDTYPHHEGVDHGPYEPVEGDNFSQSRGLAGAVIRAYEAGRIDTAGKDKLQEGLDKSIDGELRHATRHITDKSSDDEVSDTIHAFREGKDVMDGFEYDIVLVDYNKTTQEDASEDDIDNFFDEQDSHYDDDEDNEDPLAGDVDKRVHPDETRSDEQIDHDSKYAVEPY